MRCFQPEPTRKLTWYTLTAGVQESGSRVTIASIGTFAKSAFADAQKESKSAGSACVAAIFSGANAAVARPR